MYCRKCGKFIGTDADTCDECRQRENGQTRPSAGDPYQRQYGESSRRDPYGDAGRDRNREPSGDQYGNSYGNSYGEWSNVTYRVPEKPQDGSQVQLGSAIVAAVLGYVGFLFMYLGVGLIILPVLSFVLCMIGAVPTAIAVVLGIRSILHFRETSRIRSGKRIPLLILGIVALDFALASIIFFLIILVLALGVGAVLSL